MLRGCVLRHLSVFYYVTPSGSTLTALSEIQTEPAFLACEAGTLTRTLKTTASSDSHQCTSWDQGSEAYPQSSYYLASVTLTPLKLTPIWITAQMKLVLLVT